MAIDLNLSIIQATDTPTMGAPQTWLEFPGDGVAWFNTFPLALGADFMVIAWGDDSVSFTDLLVRTQQVEAALGNPATGIGQAWPNVVVLDTLSVVPFVRPADGVNRVKRLVPSVFSFSLGPISSNTRLKVYWRT